MDRAESAQSAVSVEDAFTKKDRASELKLHFNLPGNEALVNDFICALRRKVLYQGRIYIFEHYICFYAHIFGKEKQTLIPLKDVTSVKKKKFYGFPNSIEIVWKGKRDFFTSFLKREEAYRMILYSWNKSSPYAKLFGDGEDSDGSSRSLAVTDSKKLLGSRHLASLMHMHGSADSGSSKGIARLSAPPATSGDDETEAGGSAKGSPQRDKSTGEEYDLHSDSEDDDMSETTDAHDEMEGWVAVKEEAPPPDPAMTQLLEADFDVTVHAFYKEFLSDDSQFFISWHESRADTKVQLSEWKKTTMGYVRQLTFVTPLKQKIGPSKCLCTQTQRTRLHPGEHLVFNTSQIMDIPYGDYFSVNTHWDIVPAKNGKGCKITIRLAIPFSKKTVFRNTIESSTKEQMTKAYESWVSVARTWLEDPLPVNSQDPPESCFASTEDTPKSHHTEEDNGPSHFSRAQSLAARLSTEWLPDKELLARAPTSYRSDIARVLQIQRSQAPGSGIGQLDSGNSSGRRSVTFDDQGNIKVGNDSEKSSYTDLLKPRTLIRLLLVIFLVSQVVFWIWRGLPAGPWHFLGHVPSWPHPFKRGALNISDSHADRQGLESLTERMDVLQQMLQELKDQVVGLEAKLSDCVRQHV